MGELKTKDMRDIYVDLLLDYAEDHKNMVVIDADLQSAMKTTRFREEKPEQSINVGVAEANMIGVAAGMANMGKLPFTHTFTPFATRRVFDQVTVSVAYAGLNVKMVGSDPGIMAQLNGGTHMSVDDAGMMRGMPEMTVVEPVDGVQLDGLFKQIAEWDGPVYMRLMRKGNDAVFEEGTPFELGKAAPIRKGKDVSIFASGIMVKEAIEAADTLKEEGIDASVINIHTWKPLDKDAIIEDVKTTGAAVSAENHTIYNGLGSAIAETLGEHYPAPLERVGIMDHFGEVGKKDFLMEKFGLKAKNIVEAAKKAVKRKG